MPKNQSLKKQLLACAVSSLVLVSCSPKVDNGGYVHEDPIKNLVTVGTTTREDVRTKLGSPSSQSSFGDETWYYITDRKEAYAFLKPEIVEQEVTSIAFDTKGVVSKVDNYTIDNGQDFDLVKRTTPTEGHTLGFFEQILGNIGRFNRPGGNDSVAPGRKGN